MKILIADDETKIRNILVKYATFEGYEVDEAANGAQAVDLCALHDYDLVVMDVMMPEMDGIRAVEQIRRKSGVPILMLSARGEEYDRIRGFEAGIDDYVVKPFSPKELMMRIAAILKRTTARNGAGSDLFIYQDLSVNFPARIVTLNGERVRLSHKEYELLAYLIEKKNVAVPRNQLIRRVWGDDFYGDDRTLDTHVKLLRKQLGPYAGLIVTVRGVGYRFEA